MLARGIIARGEKVITSNHVDFTRHELHAIPEYFHELFHESFHESQRVPRVIPREHCTSSTSRRVNEFHELVITSSVTTRFHEVITSFTRLKEDLGYNKLVQPAQKKNKHAYRKMLRNPHIPLHCFQKYAGILVGSYRLFKIYGTSSIF